MNTKRHAKAGTRRRERFFLTELAIICTPRDLQNFYWALYSFHTLAREFFLMTCRKTALIFVLFIGFTGFAAAQTAEIMDKIIGSSALSLSQTTYLVFAASGKLAEDSSTDQAYQLVRDLAWLSDTEQAERPMKLGEFAYLLVRSFGLSPGWLGDWFPGPHYAYRYLVYRAIIPGTGDPDDPIAGADAVRILGKVMDAVPQEKRS